MSTIYEIKDFKKFYDENESFVRKSLHYIIKNEDKISDIVQEVFVKVWKKSDKFQQKSNVKTWLYRITVNCAYDHLRKEKKHFSNSYETTDQPGPINKSNQVHQRQLIKNSIGLLDDKHKVVFVMYYINQVSQDEIANIAGVPVGTVKSRLSKAREIVSDYLKRQGVNYE